MLWKQLLICLFMFQVALDLQAQEYEIEVNIDNFEGDTLLLGYYFVDKQYLQDTAYRVDGSFIFSGEDTLAHGLYLLVLPPAKDIYEVIVNEDQNFKVSIDHAEGIKSMRYTGHKENAAFADYIRLLNDLRPQGDSIRQLLNETDKGTKVYEDAERQLTGLSQKIDDYKDNIRKQFPGSVLELIINAGITPNVPDMEEIADPEERKRQRFLYYKSHYFDAYDLTDSRLLRTPFFYRKVDEYLEKLTIQVPDSINSTIDYLLGQFSEDEEMFKVHLIQFINKYAQSKIVGFDAVYVHLVDNYYAKEKAPWVSEEQLNKMTKNSKTLKPILLGKIAPDIELTTRAGEKMRLHELKSNFTVLYFWDPDCGHCKKSIPKVVEFYENFKDRGVEVLAVCTKLTDKVPDCWEAVDDRGMDIWINAADPYLRSRYKQIYDIRSTPMIYILDENKEILSKKISSSQLEEVLTKLIQMKAENKL